MIQQMRAVIRSVRNRDGALEAIVILFLLPPFLLLGWVSIGYARINPFLLLMVYPMLNGAIILAAVMMIRTEGKDFPNLAANPEIMKSKVTAAVLFSTVVVLIEHALFEVITIALRDVFRHMWSDTVDLSHYVPGPVSLAMIVGIAVSLYACYISFVPWMLGNMDVSTLSDEDGLVRFKQPVTGLWFVGAVIGIVLFTIPIWVIVNEILTRHILSFMATIYGVLTILYGFVISRHMWRAGFLEMQKRYANSELEES